MKFVISTMTNSVGYAIYQNVGDLPTLRKKIIVFGGANLPSVRSGFGDQSKDSEGTPMWTAAGIATPVSDSDFEILKDHWLFQKHLKRGCVSISDKDVTGDHKAIKKIVSGMDIQRDNHAQLTKSTIQQRIVVKTPAELEQETGFRI